MIRTTYRSLLAVILAMVTTFLVSCGSPTATPPTYTSQKIAQIQRIATPLSELRDQMSILEAQIQNREWTDVESFIHGPLGELRQKMSYLTRELLPQDQKAASKATKDLFARLEAIDAASLQGDYLEATDNYSKAVRDFDQFLQLLPQPSESAVSS